MTRHQFSGMLNQHEFKERYIFMTRRIENGLSREDIAFLLGRTSYHVVDYEELSCHIKMDYEDYEVMAALFKTPAPLPLAFNTKLNKVDISNERHMIRGTFTKTDEELRYHFIHPWTTNGLNKPVSIVEPIQSKAKNAEEILTELTLQLARLIDFGYFQNKNPAMAIYHHMYINTIPDWRPLLVPMLKRVVFEFIRTEKLQLINERDHIYYQVKL